MPSRILLQLEELIEIQEQLNISVDPEWRENRDLQDWTRATWTECAELIHDLPWYWWKR